MDKLDMESKNIVLSNIEKIKELFPNVITEDNGKEVINFEMLKQELSEVIIDEKKEKYQLTWPGKKQAIINANSPINKTLRPLKDKSINFDSTKNIYIEGDNLDALKLLQESYLNKIKCIYIDPPYNTGNDFIYNDNFTVNLNKELIESGQVDEIGNKLISNNISNGRFHSDWLSMIYSRIKLARNLLSEDGVIFISIDDNELVNLKKICDDIFGEVNFVANIIVTSAPAGTQSSTDFAVQQSYCLVYRKTDKFFTSYIKNTPEELAKKYNYGKDEKGNYYIERLWKRGIGGRMEDVPSLHFPVYYNPNTKEILVDDEYDDNDKNFVKIIPYQTASVLGRWTWSKEKMKKEREFLTVEIVAGEYKLHKKVYEYSDCGKKPYTIIDSKIGRTELGSLEIKSIFDNKVFDYPKYSGFVKYLINLQSDKNAIILDFFSGSATTAQAVMQLNAEDGGNRNYILIQIPEQCSNESEAYKSGYRNLCDIGEERIRRVSEKIKKETNVNIDYGFRVFKVDSSNMKDIFYKPNEVQQANLFDYMSNVKEDRSPEDLLTQVILDLGLTLDLPIEEKALGNNKVYYVAENALVACFDDVIDINIIDTICECQPLRVVFKDSSFRTDKDKINLEERVKKSSAVTKICIL